MTDEPAEPDATEVTETPAEPATEPAPPAKPRMTPGRARAATNAQFGLLARDLDLFLWRLATGDNSRPQREDREKYRRLLIDRVSDVVDALTTEQETGR